MSLPYVRAAIRFGVGLACLYAPLLWAQSADPEWTQLRGTDGRAIGSAEARPPVKINLATQQQWSLDVPGTGWSSPVYEQDLIWLTTAETQQATPEEIQQKLQGDPLAGTKTLAKSVQLRALAVDRQSGELVLNRLLRTIDRPEPINPMNSYASPTAAIHEGRVVCHFGSYGTWCLDANSGEEIWKAKYQIDHSVGPGSSPVIFGDRVILVCDGTDKQFIVALDLATGKEVWKTDRPPIRAENGEFRKAYSTPLLIEVREQSQVVIPGAQWVAAYALDTGSEIWRCDHGDGFSVTPMATYEAGLIVFSTGFMRPEFVAVDPTGTGDVTQSHLKWRTNGAPTMSSFVAEDGRLYSIGDKGIMVCLDVKTGEVLNRKRIGGNFSSSPILAGGNLYLSSREGVLTVVRCSSDLEVVASNQFENSLMATPVLIDDDLLLRTEDRLIRIKP